MNNIVPILVVRGGVDDRVLSRVENEVSDRSGEQLYIVIESNGGDPSIAYRVMNMLQAKYTEIIAVIPTEAYSAATLMALGADRIYMRKSACLGPLDTQIPHPTDGSMISSLEIRDTPNTLAGLVSSIAKGFNEDLLYDMHLGKKDAAAIAMDNAIKIINPVSEKIDPIYLQKSTRSSKLGQKYAENLLSARMMKSMPKLAEYVSIILANNYDYHGYAIMLDEAKNRLALNVEDTANLGIWGDIKKIFEKTNTNGISYTELELGEDIPTEQKEPAVKKIKSEKTPSVKQPDNAKMTWKGGDS